MVHADKQIKKISLILGSYWGQCQGGAELQAHYLEKEALRLGWDTHYSFLSDGSRYENHEKTILHPINMKKIWIKLGNIKYPYAGHLFHSLSTLKPDIIYQRGGLSFTGIAAFYAQRNKCKFIFHIAADWDVKPVAITWKRFYLLPEYLLMQYGIKNADIIIAQTQFQKKKLNRHYGRDAILIPNGHPIPRDCKKDRTEIKILWIGNWKPVKQPQIFIKLAGAISPMGKVHFIMLGRTNGYSKLVVDARKNSIEIRGEIPNDKVNQLLENAHLLINTSYQEGFSNTFIQAWMRRVPVISLKVDPDNIIQGNGLGRCSGSFNKLVQDTKELIADNVLRETMGAQARKYAVKHHSLNNIESILKLMTD